MEQTGPNEELVLLHTETFEQVQVSQRKACCRLRPKICISVTLAVAALVAVWCGLSTRSSSQQHGVIQEIQSLAATQSRLFCFAVTVTHGNEIDLVRMQYEKKLGIFQCDHWAVYSTEKTWLDKEKHKVNTSATPGPPSKLKPMWGQMRSCNVEYFLRAWRRVAEDPRLEKSDWVIKVDPDAVFFADRLRPKLAPFQQPGVKKFVKNCRKLNSMQGPLEILSQATVKSLIAMEGSCKAGISYWKEIGEDQYMTECLTRGDCVAAQPIEVFSLLQDMYCDAPWQFSCENTGSSVALHPFKKVSQWANCYSQSTGAHVAIPPATPTPQNDSPSGQADTKSRSCKCDCSWAEDKGSCDGEGDGSCCWNQCCGSKARKLELQLKK